MDNLDSIDPYSPAFKHALLQDARRDLAVFYRNASAIDASLMDALVMAHAALKTIMNAPRNGLPASLRTEVERAASANEQFFSELREQVRACPTFQGLKVEDQLLVEWGVFQVKLPLGG